MFEPVSCFLFLSKLCHMIKGSLLVVMTTDIYISKNWGRTLLFGVICGKFHHNGKIKHRLGRLPARTETTEQTSVPFGEQKRSIW